MAQDLSRAGLIDESTRYGTADREALRFMTQEEGFGGTREVEWGWRWSGRSWGCVFICPGTDQSLVYRVFGG